MFNHTHDSANTFSGEAREQELFLLHSDPLHVLGLNAATATKDDIERSFKTKSAVCDPNSPHGRARASELKQARALLLDPTSAYYRGTRVPGDPARMRLFMRLLPARQRRMGYIYSFVMGVVLFVLIFCFLRSLFTPLLVSRRHIRQSVKSANARRNLD